MPKERGKKPVLGARPRLPLDDDRPTEIHAAEGDDPVQNTREQLIAGSTITEMMRRQDHKLSQVLLVLVMKARQDLPGAEIDPRASLLLEHQFEFDRRVGYRLLLKVFDGKNRRVEVRAEVDADGRAIRSGSMLSRTFAI